MSLSLSLQNLVQFGSIHLWEQSAKSLHKNGFAM